MARDAKDLERLAREIASLSPEERAKVMAKATEMEFHPLPADFDPPTLRGGTAWVGGSLRREEMYGDDGR